MKVNGAHYRTVWMEGASVFMIEQNLLPFDFRIHECRNYLDTCHAIKTMIVRGAGAIGASAGFAMAQAFLQGKGDFITQAKKEIEATRPTAQNLFYATNRVYQAAQEAADPIKVALQEAQAIADEDADNCRRIGEHGAKL